MKAFVLFLYMYPFGWVEYAEYSTDQLCEIDKQYILEKFDDRELEGLCLMIQKQQP